MWWKCRNRCTSFSFVLGGVSKSIKYMYKYLNQDTEQWQKPCYKPHLNWGKWVVTFSWEKRERCAFGCALRGMQVHIQDHTAYGLCDFIEWSGGKALRKRQQLFCSKYRSVEFLLGARLKALVYATVTLWQKYINNIHIHGCIIVVVVFSLFIYFCLRCVLFAV